jgi:hypothetical protein
LADKNNALGFEEIVGLKPFVVSKAKRFLSNYSHRELESLSGEMVAIYHSARGNGPELDIALEQFILKL